LKRLAVDDGTEVLQQAADFWRKLMQNPVANRAGWRHVLHFQLRLLDDQVAHRKGDADKLLNGALSIWADQMGRNPAERMFRYGLSEIYQRLPAVYPAGPSDQAVQDICNALDRADGYESRKAILSAIVSFPEVLSALAARHPEEPQFQAGLARHYAERGNAPLADAARRTARALFEEKLAKEPENAALAADLADLLVIDTTRPATLDKTRKDFARTRFADPWQKLAAAYHLGGDHKAINKLLEHHPAAAIGIGDLYVAVGAWERAIAEYRKLVSDQRPNVALLTKLATACQSAGRTREAVPYLAKESAANPMDTLLFLKVAALQAWFGQEKELAATRQRVLAFAKDASDWMVAERAAKLCSLLPSTSKAERDAALALGRKAVELIQGRQWGEWCQLTLGMAEYRSGNDAAAQKALLAAAKAGSNNPYITDTAAFYRAMSLFQEGKKDEARKLALETAARMTPLPRDEQNPLPSTAEPWNDLIPWLGYKEAKAMIKFDVAPAAPVQTKAK
jgi:tetratricopeptide (TPR) repeat protein